MKKIILIFILLAFLTSCGSQKENFNMTELKTWDDVVSEGKDKTVTILMWGGNESVNQYMDTYVADALIDMYNIELIRVPNDAHDYLSKLLNEKKNNIEVGTADLLWINAENFLTAKQGGLLFGPFTNLLKNLDLYYDENADDLKYDSGTSIEGYEGIWGRAQLVLSYDSEVLPDPPKTYKELLEWAKLNPGKFTYPTIPDDFVGVAFVRNAYYELTGEKDAFQSDMTREEFEKLSEPVMEYFKDLSKYLWNEGKAYPSTQAKMDDLFKNGEVNITMGFEIGKTSGQIAAGVYPDSVKTYVFDTGTIGNSHYLAIPYNSQKKAAAILVIDFLQSPEAQLKKMDSKVWGDMPAFDPSKISEELKTELKKIELQPGTLSIEELTSKRNPEMKSKYIEWIKEIWIKNIGE